jgi:hypothetical protein
MSTAVQEQKSLGAPWSVQAGSWQLGRGQVRWVGGWWFAEGGVDNQSEDPDRYYGERMPQCVNWGGWRWVWSRVATSEGGFEFCPMN